jgi:hypothetical protein
MGTSIGSVQAGNASAGSRGKAATVCPSSYRATLILITGATGVATGHFEDKTIVAYCRSEAAIARLFIRVRDRVRSALGLQEQGRD